MKYTKELQDKEVKFEITLDEKEWQEELEHVYEHTKSKYKVEGFRNGKAPRKVIEKQYGEMVFYDEAINNCFYKYYDEVLSKEPEVEVVGNPSVDIPKINASTLVLSIKQTLKPKVTLGEYKNLGLEKPTVKVVAKDVNDRLQSMQQKSARMVKIDREIKKGDTAVFDFSGSVDGVKFDGGTATNYELEIGSGQFIAGFEDQMIGMKAGEHRDVKVTFPADYPAENLKGKEAVFAVDVHEVREKVLPELDDEFAKNVSEFDTLEELKKDIKKQITMEKQQKADYELQEQMIEKISQNATVEIPEVMIDEQVEEFIHDFEHRLAHQGLKLEDYLAFSGTNLDDLKKLRRTDAEKTCKTRLVLEQIIKQEDIKVEDQDIEQSIAVHAGYAEQNVEEFKKNLDEHMLSHIVNEVLINKLLKFLKEANNI